MKTDKSLMVGAAVSHGDAKVPVPAIVGPILGLLYIVVLPFMGVATFILSSGHRTMQSLTPIRRRATQATVDAQEGVRAEAVGLRDFLQPLIDGLECEFVVIDRELHITQYYTPTFRHNKLLEQSAIGRHCFEVTHGRNRPCESHECECPVRKVLETNQAVVVTHRHINQFERESREKLVEVLASPVRDSQGRVTQVVELIRDAATVN